MSEQADPAKTLLQLVGLLALVPAILVVFSLLDGLLIVYSWAWFLVPLLHAPALPGGWVGFVAAIGIHQAVRFVAAGVHGSARDLKPEYYAKSQEYQLVMALVTTGFWFGVAYTAHLVLVAQGVTP